MDKYYFDVLLINLLNRINGFLMSRQGLNIYRILTKINTSPVGTIYYSMSFNMYRSS